GVNMRYLSAPCRNENIRERGNSGATANAGGGIGSTVTPCFCLTALENRLAERINSRPATGELTPLWPGHVEHRSRFLRVCDPAQLPARFQADSAQSHNKTEGEELPARGAVRRPVLPGDPPAPWHGSRQDHGRQLQGCDHHHR